MPVDSQISPVLRLGTRGSLLARMQSQAVADELMSRLPGLRVELVLVKTTGDQVTDKPLHHIGGKGLFTKELELALLAGHVDFAVHSMKDVPVTMPLVDQGNLVIAAVPQREDPRDLFLSRISRSLDGLPHSAKIATGSLRRGCQILARRSDLRVEPVRGNVDTRIRKLADKEFDAVVLATAGVKRCGLFDGSYMTPIDTDQLLPAAGQGALALQCRADDAKTLALLRVMNEADDFDCVAAERAVVLALHGDCHSPIAALAQASGTQIMLEAAVGASGGKPPVIRAKAAVPRAEFMSAVRLVVDELLAKGAAELLKA